METKLAVRDCEKCGTEFQPARSTARYCGRKCMTNGNRDRQFKHRYGITLEQRDALRTEQEFRCAICSRHEEEVGLLRTDHDHATGKVRAMLCHGCNTSLGHFQDSAELLTAAASYLIQHEGSDS